jgi:Hypothetical glycosyl hydrolase family 15
MRAILAAIVAIGCGGSSAAPDGATTGDDGPGGDGGEGPLTRLPDTTNGIHLFADQLDPGYSDALVHFAATHYAGTQKMLKDANARFVAVNPNWFLLHYRLGSSSGPVEYIHDNMWSSDFASVTTHEDWFMHNEAGARHHDPGSNWDINDISSTGFRDYWTQSVIADIRATGAQGVFADSFEAGISGYGVTDPDTRFDGTNPANPALWANGDTWIQQKKEWIDAARAAFAATPEHFAFVPNIGAMITGWANIDYSTIDGAMLEGFGYQLAEADWVLGMNRAIKLTAAHKFIIVQSYPSDVAGRQFLLATYLLLKGTRTFINLGGSGVIYFPEYALDFGPPLADLPADVSAYRDSGVYRRDFANGMVLVNPSSSAVSVTLPSAMRQASATGGGAVGDADLDMNGNYIGGTVSFAQVTNLTLQPQTAALLLAP